MNFRKMLDYLIQYAIIQYAKADRPQELREMVQRLVDDERARRKRTAARLWIMRGQHRDLLAIHVSIVDVSSHGGTQFSEIKKRETQERRQAVEDARK